MCLSWRVITSCVVGYRISFQVRSGGVSRSLSMEDASIKQLNDTHTGVNVERRNSIQQQAGSGPSNAGAHMRRKSEENIHAPLPEAPVLIKFKSSGDLETHRHRCQQQQQQQQRHHSLTNYPMHGAPPAPGLLLPTGQQQQQQQQQQKEMQQQQQPRKNVNQFNNSSPKHAFFQGNKAPVYPAGISAQESSPEPGEENMYQFAPGSGIDQSREFPSGRYIAKKVLGSGTYGKVLLCGDAKYKGTGVAIKLVRKDSMPFRKAARMEAKILRAVNGACGTLKLLRCFEHQGHPCMSLELLGVSLYDILKRKTTTKASPFDAAKVRDVGTQLLAAIEYLHGMGIIHTDVKTDNILLSSGAEHRCETEPLKIKLVDFGSALYDKDFHPALVGTMHYRPPEAVLQAGWSYPLDVWGVGCVLCEVAKGSKVFELVHDDVHLAMIERLIGPIPHQLLVRGGERLNEHNERLIHRCGSGSPKYTLAPPRASGSAQARAVRPLAEMMRNHPELLRAVTPMFELVDSKRISAKNALLDPYFMASAFSKHRPEPGQIAKQSSGAGLSPRVAEAEVQYDDVFDTPAWGSNVQVAASSTLQSADSHVESRLEPGAASIDQDAEIQSGEKSGHIEQEVQGSTNESACNVALSSTPGCLGAEAESSGTQNYPLFCDVDDVGEHKGTRVGEEAFVDVPTVRQAWEARSKLADARDGNESRLTAVSAQASKGNDEQGASRVDETTPISAVGNSSSMSGPSAGSPLAPASVSPSPSRRNKPPRLNPPALLKRVTASAFPTQDGNENPPVQASQSIKTGPSERLAGGIDAEDPEQEHVLLVLHEIEKKMEKETEKETETEKEGGHRREREGGGAVNERERGEEKGEQLVEKKRGPPPVAPPRKTSMSRFTASSSQNVQSSSCTTAPAADPARPPRAAAPSEDGAEPATPQRASVQKSARSLLIEKLGSKTAEGSKGDVPKPLDHVFF